MRVPCFRKLPTLVKSSAMITSRFDNQLRSFCEKWQGDQPGTYVPKTSTLHVVDLTLYNMCFIVLYLYLCYVTRYVCYA